MTLYHHAPDSRILHILDSGVLAARSYGDFHQDETYYLRVFHQQVWPPPRYRWTPSVLFLTSAEQEKDMVAWQERERSVDIRSKLRRTWRFTVRVPSPTVAPWNEFARQLGAAPEWLEYQSPLRKDEYLTTNDVPCSQWLEVRHQPTNRTLRRVGEGWAVE
ncbi:hypothetical protein [Mycobacterium shigaense]|uniref:hypothetical protein n=1 Tax=Mycobacterium shigaense TaxID=722731 RepID=UPI002ADFB558|nr:hypothetical protein [Mycobacterium shigaense]MEA1121711.1 hypothetical protein [Mycobacterium shigaense]